MPTPSANESLQDDIITHQVDLMRLEPGVRASVVGHLELAAQDIESRLVATKVADPATPTLRQRRLKALLKQVKDITATGYKASAKQLQSELLDLADYTQEAQKLAFRGTFQSDVLSVTLTKTDLKQIATNPLLEGSPAEAWWAKQEADTRARFQQEIRLGLTSGETTDQIARRVRGKVAGQQLLPLAGQDQQVPVTQGGVLEISKRQAEALTRTAIHKVSNDVQQEVYRANSDLIKGHRVVATLDGRTSEICMARSGGAWDLNGDPLPESTVQYKFPGAPPWHFNAITAGELVHTWRGPVPIENVVVGDRVLTHRAEYQTVYAVMSKPVDSGVVALTTDSGRRVVVTEDHPLAVAERGWVRAGEVVVGEQVFEYLEQPAEVDGFGLWGELVPDYGKPEFEQPFVPDTVTLGVPVGASLAVQLNDNAIHQEIQNVPLHGNLEPVLDGVLVQQGPQYDLPGGGVVGQVDCPLPHVAGDHTFSLHGVGRGHSFTGPGVGGGVGFGEPVSPVGLPTNGDPLPAVLGAALPWGADFDSVTPGPVTATGFSPAVQPVNGRQGKPLVKVVALDEGGEGDGVGRVGGFGHASIVSARRVAYTGRVYNLAVTGDETYVVGGVVVHNCRSVMAPLTKSWSELIEESSGKKVDLPEIKPTVRASMDGFVPADHTYETWLRKKDAAQPGFAKAQLGEQRYALWQKGKITTHQLVDQSGNPRTLAQLRKQKGLDDKAKEASVEAKKKAEAAALAAKEKAAKEAAEKAAKEKAAKEAAEKAAAEAEAKAKAAAEKAAKEAAEKAAALKAEFEKAVKEAEEKAKKAAAAEAAALAAKEAAEVLAKEQAQKAAKQAAALDKATKELEKLSQDIAAKKAATGPGTFEAAITKALNTGTFDQGMQAALVKSGFGQYDIKQLKAGKVKPTKAHELLAKAKQLDGDSGPPTPAVVPTTPTPPAPFPDALDASKMAQVGAQGGSNLGGRFRADNGDEFYIKKPKSKSHVDNEVLASKLYQLAGVDAPTVHAGKWTDGESPAVVSEWRTNLKENRKFLEGTDALPDEIGEGFVVDAWLANWDTVGLSYDNLVQLPNGKWTRVDVGGSLLYRAQGGAKGAAWGDKVVELDTFVDPKLNGQSYSVFKRVTDKQVAAGIDRVLALDAEDIKALVEQHGPGGTAEKAQMLARLLARREDLRARRSGYTEAAEAPPKKKEARVATAEARRAAYVVDAEFAERVTASKSNGTVLAADKDLVQDNDILVWTELTPGGGQQTRVQFKVTPAGSKVVEDVLGADLEAAKAVPLPTTQGGAIKPHPDDVYWGTIQKAAKTVNVHVKDGEYNFTTLDQLGDIKVNLQIDLKGTTEGELKDMLLHYVATVDKIQEAVAKKTVTGPVGQYEVGQNAPKPAVAPKAGRQINRVGNYQDRTTTFEEGLGTTTTGDNNFDVGEAFHIQAGNGIQITFVPNDGKFEEAAGRALHGTVVVNAPGAPSVSNIARAIEAIEELGIPTAAPSAAYEEALYLHRGVYQRKKAHLAGYRKIWEDDSLTPEQKVPKLKRWIKTYLKVDVDAVEGYNPKGVTRHLDGSGFRHWERWDLSVDQIHADLPRTNLFHSTGSLRDSPRDKTASTLSAIIQSGGEFTSTTGRIRKGVNVEDTGGGSTVADVNTGGASYFFTRLKDQGATNNGFYFRLSAINRQDSVSYGKDEFGRIEALGRRGSTTDEFFKFKRASGNETIFKEGLTVDDLDFIRVRDEEERQGVLAAFAKHGISTLSDGRTVEEIVVFGSKPPERRRR